MKKEIKVEITSVYMDGKTIDEGIDELNDLKKTYSGTYKDLVLEWDCYDESKRLCLYGTREETDGEYNKRQEQAEKSKLFTEKRDREEYERLKKRFGNE